MKYLLLLFMLSGCGAMKNLDKMSDGLTEMKQSVSGMASSLSETKNSMGKTVEGIHLQTLSGAITQMFSLNATKYVSPSSSTPTQMVGPAYLFAKEATENEILQQLFLWDMEIKNSSPDNITPETQKQCDKDKFVALTAIQLVSAMMTHEKLVSILSTNSEYSSLSDVIILLRYNFLTTYLIDLAVFSFPINNLKGYESAIQYINEVKYLEKHYKKHSYEIKGFFDSSINQKLTFSVDNVSISYIKKLKTKMDKELDSKYKNTKEYSALLKELEN